MFKVTIFILAVAIASSSAAPKPLVVAPGIVTSRSSQVISRTYNGLAAPIVAQPVLRAAPIIAQPVLQHSQIVAQPLLQHSQIVAQPLLKHAPLVAQTAVKSAPIVEASPVVETFDPVVKTAPGVVTSEEGVVTEALAPAVYSQAVIGASPYFDYPYYNPYNPYFASPYVAAPIVY